MEISEQIHHDVSRRILERLEDYCGTSTAQQRIYSKQSILT
jgi:hypothetical protein